MSKNIKLVPFVPFKKQGTTITQSVLCDNLKLDCINATAGTTVVNSPSLKIYGSGWDTDDLVARKSGVVHEFIPTSDTGVYGSYYVRHYRDDVLVQTMFSCNTGGTIAANGGVFSGNGLFGSSGSTITPTLYSSIADGATAVGGAINTTNTLSTAGSKLFSFKNNNVEKAYVDYLGGLYLDSNLTIGTAFSVTKSTGQIVAGNMVSNTGLIGCSSSVANSVQLRGSIADGGTAVGVKLGNYNTLSAVGAKPVAIYSDNFTTEVANFDKDGFLTVGVATNYGNGKKEVLKTVQTTDATVTEIWTSPAVADNETYMVEVTVVGMESDGSDRNLYHIQGLFYRDGGNVTQQGSTISLATIESDADWDCDFTVDTVNQDINVVVTGEAATTINWKANVKYFKVTSS